MSGVTSQTWENMIIDSAVCYVDWGFPTERVIGATNGGVNFGWEAFNVRSPEIDGVKGRLAGVSRITEASPQLVVNLVEWTLENILLAFPGTEVVTAGGVSRITRSGRVIPLSEYPKNVALVGTQSGTGAAVVVLVKLPMVVSGAEIPTADDTEATAALTFVGHYDPSDTESEPWEIIFPDSGTVALSKLSIATGTTMATDAAASTVIAAVSGITSGSTLTVLDSRFEIVAGNLRRTATGTVTAGEVSVSVVEEDDSATNSPRASALVFTAVAP